MSRKTWDTQYLEDLTGQQQDLLLEYYDLIKTTSFSVDCEAERVARIWNYAYKDPILCKWLELIDYFYSDIPDEGNKVENDRRAYLSEYLSTLASQTQTEEENSGIENASLFAITSDQVGSPEVEVVFLCPAGYGYVIKSVDPDNLEAMQELGEIPCDKCNKKLKEHQWVHRGKLSPQM